MKKRPIIFSAPMVRAILDGTKTQTRRIIKPKLVNGFDEPRGDEDVKNGYPFCETENGFVSAVNLCPYGQPGDWLWVRETWRTTDGWNDSSPRNIRKDAPIQYEATDPKGNGRSLAGRVRASIHMPPWASRITLEITRVWVERVQDISEEDAIKEGLDWVNFMLSFKDSFGPESWNRNDWVWVIEFKNLGSTGR